MTIVITNELQCDRCHTVMQPSVHGRNVARGMRKYAENSGWKVKVVDAEPPLGALEYQDVCPECLEEKK